jgi:hypothetical protein
MAADTVLAEALADPAVRRAVVIELRQAAETDNRNGDGAMANGQYALANANWMAAAQRQIAAQAIDGGNDFAERDADLVRAAYRAVRDRRRPTGGAQ